MDPLSEVLSLLDVQSVMSKPFEASGDWAIAFPAHDGVKFYALIEGECWLSVESVDEPMRIVSGDCLLLPLGKPFSVSSDPDVIPIDGNAILEGQPFGLGVAESKDRLHSLGGYFSLDRNQAGFLLDHLPPVIRINTPADKSMLRFCLQQMADELAMSLPGGAFVAAQLATVMLVQVLRRFLIDAKRTAGWLFALSDPKLVGVLTAVHATPGRTWTLQAMSHVAGMSRTAFVARFTARTGKSPASYVTLWRMQLAKKSLASGAPIGEIAFELGYGSVSAFSNAFKRVVGVPPRTFSVEADRNQLRRP